MQDLGQAFVLYWICSLTWDPMSKGGPRAGFDGCPPDGWFSQVLKMKVVLETVYRLSSSIDIDSETGQGEQEGKDQHCHHH